MNRKKQSRDRIESASINGSTVVVKDVFLASLVNYNEEMCVKAPTWIIQ